MFTTVLSAGDLTLYSGEKYVTQLRRAGSIQPEIVRCLVVYLGLVADVVAPSSEASIS